MKQELNLECGSSAAALHRNYDSRLNVVAAAAALCNPWSLGFYSSRGCLGSNSWHSIPELS
jgi:hypothetical protein